MKQNLKNYYILFGEEFMPRGIYTDWKLASKAMRGVQQRYAEDKYKKCSSEEEYKSFLNEKNLVLPIVDTKKDFKAQVIEQHGSLELVDWEMPFKDVLLKKFKYYGFDKVSLKLWNDQRLYVKINGMPTIYFDLEKRYTGGKYKRKNSCYIRVEGEIDRNTFENLRRVSIFTVKNKYKIKQLFKYNTVISNEKDG